ncbi:uncharacterized protein LOC122073361 [Macadamia integrifolia]|uniref:uncharacterized protein LOC122073361 n=1 Tax=Macadamia integrifolia TaxID=60698 RepID=UPI001C4EF6E4|nr:uncharacterized protein LOC122073361 [Macadamia integrifolia]
MLITLISSWLLIEKRSKILDTLPREVKKLWYDWELQVMVLLSLFLQILLILLGDRRKHITGNKIGFIIWISYLAADSVATFALGILSKTQGQTHSPTDELRALWAPFLLLHLGGPDTITAYALEDNELWWRHFLELAIQASVAFYVVFRSWTGITRVSILTIIIFVTGIIKYVERTLALRSASKDQFRDSMLSPPDPGPNYANFMEGYVSKQDEGFLVDIVKIKEARLKLKEDDDHQSHHHGLEQYISDGGATGGITNVADEDNEILLIKKAHGFFETFKRLFADLILSFQDGEESKSFIQKSSSKKAFKVLEIELGFMFDVLYTKAPIVYTPGGGLVRLICFCFTTFVFVIFTTVVGINPMKHHQQQIYYSKVDIVVTYLLAGVAIILEIYALIILLCSDWVVFWLSKKHKKASMKLLLRKKKKKEKKRWSNSMGQNNLISFCLKDNEHIRFIMKLVKLSHVHERLEMYWDTSFKNVPVQLKEIIFQWLKRKSELAANDDVKQLMSTSGTHLKKLLGWSIDVEFHQSILLWHIATDLCYYDQLVDQPNSTPLGLCKRLSGYMLHLLRRIAKDLCCYDLFHDLNSPSSPPSPSPSPSPSPDMCKLLSDYMLHLLLAHPFLLPEGIGQIRFRDTCAEAEQLFKGKKSINFTEKEACKMLLDKNTDIPPAEVKGDRSKSVLFDACRLAKSLRSLDTEERWETMTTVWVDTLAYAASQCRGPNHAKQLSRGGELLTHIWLLMAHLGITQQYQISQGQVRAKLIFK